MAPLIPTWVQPGEFTTFARSKANLPSGCIFTPSKGATVEDASYWSFQVSRGTHMAFKSDLMYLNHSCDPNIVMEFERFEARVIRHVRVGDPLTWFYPSSEWHMVQPFYCRCGASCCRGRISGASQMELWVLQQFSTQLIERTLGHNDSGHIRKQFKSSLIRTSSKAHR